MKMNNKEALIYHIRLIKDHEVDLTFDLIAKEGWTLTRLKFSLLCQSNPDSVYVMVTPDDVIVATVSYYLITDQEYYLGNMVVDYSFRKQGLASKLIKKTLELLPHKVIQLKAMPGTETFYFNQGFKLCQGDITHKGVSLEINADRLDAKARDLAGQKVNSPSCVGEDGTISITSFEDAFFQRLVDYDSTIRGYENTSFVHFMLKCNNVLVALSGKQESRIVGFVASHLKGDDVLFEGLFADSDLIATLLFQQVLRSYGGKQKVQLQPFPSNEFLLQFGGITDSYEFKRFSLGGSPSVLDPVKNSRVYILPKM